MFGIVGHSPCGSNPDPVWTYHWSTLVPVSILRKFGPRPPRAASVLAFTVTGSEVILNSRLIDTAVVKSSLTSYGTSPCWEAAAENCAAVSASLTSPLPTPSVGELTYVPCSRLTPESNMAGPDFSPSLQYPWGLRLRSASK